MFTQIITLAALLCVLLISPARAQQTSPCADSCNGMTFGGGAAAAGYTPPLDTWTLLRAYSFCRLTTAYNSNLVRVVRISDSNTVDYPALASGCVDWTAMATQCTTGSACYISIFYDQSGNAVNATPGGSTQVLVDPANHWANTNGVSTQNWLTFAGTTNAQPFSVVVNYAQGTPSANPGYIFADTTGTLNLIASTNVVAGYAGTQGANVAKTDGAWGVVIDTFNGTSSSISVDAGGGYSPTTQNQGLGVMSAALGPYAIGTNPASANFYREDMKFDTFIVSVGDPGSTKLTSFSAWLRAHAHI